jgi:drug/metabolite transporter (DMT)-like permease
MFEWYTIVIGLAALTSLPLLFFDLGSLKKTHRIILLILVLVAIVEYLGFYLANNGKPNIIYYNAIFVYTLPIVYLFFFLEVFKLRKANKTLQVLGLMFLLYGLVNTFFITPFQEFHSDSYIIGSLLIVGCSFYFFYSIVSKNLFLEIDLLWFPVFWVVAFLLFFYSSSILNFASVRFVTATNFELMVMMRKIINTLASIMYLVFAWSFYLPLIKNKNNIMPQELG